ncbi:hypothetical protein CAEBREN_18939 [Caenorhabditis brenneri]|uniref:G-protein coupled receptors family 1 profile domain-containing protein n=1 Tax=Caenorhabditis brenneri TaxID=135651 RepID=G0MMV5_CAEBE|nr:hypothetical protein CAEBREN_18939 [Caenorhabditis brenneri]
MYPILTILLIFQFKKYAKNRQKLFSDRQQSQSDATTKLIICITITYIIAHLPLGIMYIRQSICEDLECYVDTSALMGSTNVPTLLVTLTHMPLCFALSSQYRDTVKTLLRINRNNTVNPERSEMTTTRVGVNT